MHRIIIDDVVYRISGVIQIIGASYALMYYSYLYQ